LTVWDSVSCIHVDLVPDVFHGWNNLLQGCWQIVATPFLPKIVFPQQHRVLQPTVRQRLAFRNVRRIRDF
jgi:hypothetical protein